MDGLELWDLDGDWYNFPTSQHQKIASHVVGHIACIRRIWDMNKSGQIIATSHDLTPNGGLVRQIPLFQGNLGW